jgi:hypothetical protein
LHAGSDDTVGAGETRYLCVRRVPKRTKHSVGPADGTADRRVGTGADRPSAPNPMNGFRISWCKSVESNLSQRALANPDAIKYGANDLLRDDNLNCFHPAIYNLEDSLPGFRWSSCRNRAWLIRQDGHANCIPFVRRIQSRSGFESRCNQ